MSEGLTIAIIILSLVAAIAVAIFIAPEKKKGQQQGFVAWLNDLFNFRTLFVEKIFKFLYILSTCFCLIGGLFTLFSAIGTKYGGDYLALSGLLVMVLGPVAVRIVYEIVMMFILLVKNTIQINNKLPDNGAAPAAPAYVAPAAPNYVFCTNCGTKYDANVGRCPNCGR